ncbi:GTP-binding protein [Catenibacterium sp.]|uniref:GTP-binding protein n=1 Tax=Catenibacterium sp. TaxID=2049022 RepID=UPI002E795826|nr:GTP-binding protein [Catenibacterium sp.]MEE0491088.1 GTP-binding protein [Catenibacterium sp.]
MVQVDLITGFLGSGKTTFIKKYAKYLIDQGLHIAILENDFGAINVDMMVLEEELGDQCELEMVVGGGDLDCHRRRFKTKLISMGMRGFDRILVEPSGIYDVDEFFDVLHEEPLDKWYEIGNVIALVNSKLENSLSKQSDYLLGCQVADAGKIILSRSSEATEEEINNTITHLNNTMSLIKCKRRFNKEDCLDLETLNNDDFNSILHSGYELEGFIKMFFKKEETFSTMFFMNQAISKEELIHATQSIFNDSECGKVFRIKGFIPENDQWIELNATKDQMTTETIAKGQEIIIVIGESLNKEKIEEYIKNQHSW